MRHPLIPQPALVKSITDDDDSNEDPISRYSVPNEEDVDARALAYLLRYETMVRQQEAEDMATLAHVRPLLERIERLGHKQQDSTKSFSFKDSHLMEKEVSYKMLERALDALEASSEVMTTDKQLMMVLRTLTGKVPTDEESISWAEFLQCYKTVVSGMQTLQHLPAASEARSRARDRTLSVLSLFEPPSSKLIAEDVPRTIDEKDKPFATPDRPVERNLSNDSSRKKNARRWIKTLFIVLVILTTLITGAFFASPALQSALMTYMEDAASPADVQVPSARASPSPKTGSRVKKQPMTPRVGQPLVVDTVYRRNSMEPLRPNHERFSRLPPTTRLPQEPRHFAVRSIQNPSPSVRHVVKHSMIFSALFGGAVGAALAPLAPQVWSAIQVMVPKMVSAVTATVPAVAGTNLAVTVGAIAVGSLAISALIRRGVGFILFHVFKRGSNKQK